MARRKNVKRIDPRYFLHETVNRGGDPVGENYIKLRDSVRALAAHYLESQDPEVRMDPREITRAVAEAMDYGMLAKDPWGNPGG